MKLLPNGCQYSGVKVLPANWKTSSSTKKGWKVYYRFFHPELTGKGTPHPKGKYVAVKGMNVFTDITERRNYVKGLIDAIEEDLQVFQFNPITGTRIQLYEEQFIDYEIHPDTPFIKAMEAALEKREVSVNTKKDLRSVLKYTTLAAKDLNLAARPVKDVCRRHVKAILDYMKKVKENTVVNKKTGAKGVWTPNNYNYYRSHLMMLFDELCQCETIENNPVDKIKKKPHIAKKRTIMTDEEKIMVNTRLKVDHYPFWRLMRIFFRSGSRETEIMKVKRSDVNIETQTVIYEVRKGRNPAPRQVTRAIADDVLELWKEAVAGAGPNDYIFAKGFMPGTKKMGPDRITKTWQKVVKDEYGITADFYAMKHDNTTQTAELVGTALAAKHNRHTEEILRQRYDLNGEAREQAIIRGTVIPFIPIGKTKASG
jgi:integrase